MRRSVAVRPQRSRSGPLFVIFGSFLRGFVEVSDFSGVTKAAPLLSAEDKVLNKGPAIS